MSSEDGRNTHTSNKSRKTKLPTVNMKEDTTNGRQEKNSQWSSLPQTLAVADCPEKIVFCVDLSAEMNIRRYRAKAGGSYTAMELVKKGMRMFAYNKQYIANPAAKHQFALAVLHEEALWLTEFTSNISELLTHIEELKPMTAHHEKFDLTTLFDLLLEKATPAIIRGTGDVLPPFIVRAVVIYGRSHCIPFFSSHNSLNSLLDMRTFFLDIIYLNEPPSEENKSELIFHELCDLDRNSLSYLFHVSKAPTKVFDAFASVMAHPLQRVPQNESGYKVEPDLSAFEPPEQMNIS